MPQVARNQQQRITLFCLLCANTLAHVCDFHLKNTYVMNRQNVFLNHVDQLSEVAGKFTAIQVSFFSFSSISFTTKDLWQTVNVQVHQQKNANWNRVISNNAYIHSHRCVNKQPNGERERMSWGNKNVLSSLNRLRTNKPSFWQTNIGNVYKFVFILIQNITSCYRKSLATFVLYFFTILFTCSFNV